MTAGFDIDYAVGFEEPDRSRSAGKVDEDAGAAAGLALDLDLAAVLANDAADDEQAEATTKKAKAAPSRATSDQRGR